MDGKYCSECDHDYYLLEPGYCIGINYCLKGAIYNKCKKCFPGYYLSNYDGSCTKESKCDIGDKHLGICLECETDYYVNNAKTCTKCYWNYITGGKYYYCPDKTSEIKKFTLYKNITYKIKKLDFIGLFFNLTKNYKNHN